MLLFVLGLTTILFTSCGNDDIIENKKPDLQTQIGNAVYVLDSLTVTSKLQSISEDGTLVFNDLPIDKQPEIGDIIVSGITDKSPYGFFYKVKKISQNTKRTTIETEDASLEEVIDNGEISTTIDLDDYFIGVYDENDNPIEYTTMRSGQSEVSAKIININEKISVSGGGAGTISIKGSLELTNALDLDFDIEDYNFKKFRAVYKIKSNLKASVSGELEGKIAILGEEGKLIYTIKLKPIIKMIGYFPLVIKQSIPIVLKIDLTGKMKPNIDMEYTSSVEIGTLYENNKFNEISDYQSNNKVNSQLVLSGGLKLTVEPQYKFSLYGLEKINSLKAFAGLYAEGELSQDIANLLKDRYGINPEIAIYSGIDAGVRANLKIFSKKLVNWEFSRELLKNQLYKSAVFPQFSDITFQDKTENSIKVSSIATAPLPQFLFPVSEYGFCISKNPLPDIGDLHVSLGAMTTSTANLSTPFTNLDTNTTYYVCPYFANWFGYFFGKVQSFSLEKKDDPTGDWVLINGVRWATRNVGEPGTFVANPEDYGKYYQWNKSTTDWTAGWDGNGASSWLPANDPSPVGYRVPTLEEIQSLTNTTYVSYEWTTRNGVSGGKFTDRTSGNSIFLPAAGFSYWWERENIGSYGGYWSSTPYGSYGADLLGFNSGGASWGWDWGWGRQIGFPVRPVAE